MGICFGVPDHADRGIDSLFPSSVASDAHRSCSSAAGLARNHGQHQRGRMLRIVINLLVRFEHASGSENRLASVQVPIEARKIATRYIQADAVTRFENVARCPHVDVVSIDFAGRDGIGLLR